MKMISEFSITTDTHWYEENSYDGEKLFEHKTCLDSYGIRMYIDYRGTEFKIDLLFSNSILNSQIETRKISLIGIPAILNKNSTLIYDLIVKNKNHENIHVEKFRLEWESNIISSKVREFKQFCGLNWMGSNKEFDDFANVNMNFKLILNQISMFTFNQYCPTNLKKYKL